MSKDSTKKTLKNTALALTAAYAVLDVIAKIKKPDSVYQNEPEQKNPMEGKKTVFVEDSNDKENADGKRGHLEDVGPSNARLRKKNVYEKYLKRALDKSLSFAGLVVLSPVMLGISAAIKMEDPGPVLFTQKRVGEDKQYFKLHKFRSMKMSTPHDVPTHMLENPDSYITKVGGFIRKHSLDELPQIWDIFIGNMSIVGPRPALWNQDVLTAERDKYGANDIKPGLTGWAQINGRDELEIPDKAKLDGEYTKALEGTAKEAAAMDKKCFLGSVGVFAKDDSVVEGGTGEISREEAEKSLPDEDTVPVKHKNILITGANSYIGDNVREYLLEENHYLNHDYYSVDVKDTMGWDPVPEDFKDIDVVFNVAGIAHRKETDENRHLYYEVNRDLVVKIAKAAKEAGVKQFILLSSMSVYGKSTGYITKNSTPEPVTAYGMSKLEADEELSQLSDDSFKIAYLRPPMVYGYGCKGNYQLLRKFALKSPVFPDYKNQRSMIYIGNLCEFVKRVIDREEEGLFFPQNAEYVNTSELVKLVATDNGKNILEVKLFNPALKIGTLSINLIKKVFGDLTYQKVDTVSKFDFKESVKLTEENEDNQSDKYNKDKIGKGKKALFIASMGSMLDNFNRENIKIVQELGYDVTLAANFNSNEDSNSHSEIESFTKEMESKGCHIVQIDFCRSLSNVKQQTESVMQVRKLLKKGFDLVHCHSPICAAITRIEYEKYRKQGGKLIYTAHGFHFYDGAPLKNWLLFDPIEKELSRFTDVLITINKEDFNRAKNHFFAKKTVYVPGVGVDVKKFSEVSSSTDRNKKREELGINDSDILLLSVGELNENKNHSVVIKALGELQKSNKIGDNHFVYLIAGTGNEKEALEELAAKQMVDLRLLGYRKDIGELLAAADLYILPSIREGLNVSLMEAMAAGKPCLAGKIRGNVDLIDSRKGGELFNPEDVQAVVNAIATELSYRDNWSQQGLYNQNKIWNFDSSIIKDDYDKIIVNL